MPFVTPIIIYNKMIDVTNYSKDHKVLNRIKKFDQKERELALKIINNPRISEFNQTTLDSMGKKLFTEESHNRKTCCQKIAAFFANLFKGRIASRKLIKPLLSAQKLEVPQTVDVPKKVEVPQKPTIPPKTETLEGKFLNRLKNGTAIQQKKEFLYSKAKESFEKHGCAENLSYERKVFNDSYWLKQPFNPKPVQFETIAPFYNYNPEGQKTNVWIDFANSALGGGAGEGGFVQEEKMFAEFYDLFKLFANHEDKNREFWCDIDTRVGNKDTKSKDSRIRVGHGVPSPILIKNAHRTQIISPDLYGSKTTKHYIGLDDISLEELKTKVKEIKPQTAHILAIAAPRLYSKTHQEQFNLDTLKDLFNQLMAGLIFTAEKEPNLLVHSGPFGCGAFHNSSKAVWLLHRLAAAQLGIDTTMHGYSRDYKDAWEEISPQFIEQNGIPKSLESCLKILSNYLSKNPN